MKEKKLNWFLKKKKVEIQNDSIPESADVPNFEEYLVAQKLILPRLQVSSSKLKPRSPIGYKKAPDSIFGGRSKTSAEPVGRPNRIGKLLQLLDEQHSHRPHPSNSMSSNSVSVPRRAESPRTASGDKVQRTQLPKASGSLDARMLQSRRSVRVSEWLRRNRLPLNTRIFIVNDAYPDLRKALLSRGWVENCDAESQIFHFKFELKNRDIEYSSLEDYQKVNHFERASAVTTKSGLCANIKMLPWAADANPDHYFPCCFDFAKEEDFQEFMDYFKVVAAESILKRFIYTNQSDLSLHSTKIPDSQSILGHKISELPSYLISVILQVEAARAISIRRLGLLNPDLDQGLYPEFSDPDEWSCLKSELLMPNFFHTHLQNWLPKAANWNQKTRSMSPEVIPSRIKTSHQDVRSSAGSRNNLQPKIQSAVNNQVPVHLRHVTLANWLHPMIEEVRTILQNIERFFPQTYINGSRNIWILKPSGLSRGRGISLHSSLDSIISKARLKPALQSSGIRTKHIMHNSFVVQKYIESPLLYSGRKVDFRVWVLVTSWNPLIIWKYKEGYARITSHPYDINRLTDPYSHLTNNSINKHAANFEKEECFMTQAELQSHIENKWGQGDAFGERIEPKMREIIVGTLLCGQEIVEHRANSSEIYGFDFCLDDRLGVWLIEVNASPAWDYSSVTYSHLIDDHRKASQESQ